MEKLRVCSLCPSLLTQKRKLCCLCIPLLLTPGWKWMSIRSLTCHLSPPISREGRGGERRPPPHWLTGWRLVTFQAMPMPYALFWQCRLIRRIQNINDTPYFYTPLTEIPMSVDNHDQTSTTEPLFSTTADRMVGGKPTNHKWGS